MDVAGKVTIVNVLQKDQQAGGGGREGGGGVRDRETGW